MDPVFFCVNIVIFVPFRSATMEISSQVISLAIHVMSTSFPICTVFEYSWKPTPVQPKIKKFKVSALYLLNTMSYKTFLIRLRLIPFRYAICNINFYKIFFCLYLLSFSFSSEVRFFFLLKLTVNAARKKSESFTEFLTNLVETKHRHYF